MCYTFFVTTFGLCLLWNVLTLELNYTVTLKLPQHEVVFNEKVELMCLINGAIANLTRQWVKGKPPLDETLSYNGIITANNKHRYYESVVFLNKTSLAFTLGFVNFSETDLDTFKCIYGTKEHRIKLDLNVNFIYIPNDHDYNISIINEDSSLDVVLNISKIYPKPICRICINNRNLNFSKSDIKLVDNMFYAAVFQKQFLILKDECNAKVILVCMTGSRSAVFNTTYTAQCQKDESCKEDLYSALLSVVVCVSVIVVAVALFCSIKRKRSEDKNRDSHCNDNKVEQTADNNIQVNIGLLNDYSKVNHKNSMKDMIENV